MTRKPSLSSILTKKDLVAIDDRMTRYLKSCSLSRVMSLVSDLREEEREAKEIVQTLIYDTYGELMTLFLSICSTQSENPIFSDHNALDTFNVALSAGTTQHHDILHPIDQTLSSCYKAEQRQMFVKYITKLASLPRRMRNELRNGNYLAAIRHYNAYKDFLMSQQSDTFFSRVYELCHKLSKHAISLIYSSLCENYHALESPITPLRLVFPNFSSFHEGINYLLKSNDYTTKDLYQICLRCLEDLLSQLVQHHCELVHDSSTAFRDLTERFATGLIPDFLNAVVLCEQLSVEPLEDGNTTKRMMINGTKQVLNGLLDVALKEDTNAELLHWVESTLGSFFRSLSQSELLLNVYSDFFHNLVIFFIKGTCNVYWTQCFRDDFVPLLLDSAAHKLIIGEKIQDVASFQIHVQDMRAQCKNITLHLGKALCQCMEEWKTVLTDLFGNNTYSWTRLYCEMEYTLSSIFDPFQYVVNHFLGDSTESSGSQHHHSVAKVSVIACLGDPLTLKLIAQYNHLTGLIIAFFLNEFKTTELEKICTLYVTLFHPAGDHSLKTLEVDCGRLCVYTLDHVARRWGRELSYLFKDLMRPLCTQNTLDVEEFGTQSFSSLIYEALRVCYVSRFFFGNASSLLYHPLSVGCDKRIVEDSWATKEEQEDAEYISSPLDSCRHLYGIRLKLEGNHVSQDVMDIKKLVTRQKHVFNISLSEEPHMFIALVSYTMFQGILEQIRSMAFYPTNRSMVHYLQFSLIFLRDMLHLPVTKSCVRHVKKCYVSSYSSRLCSYAEAFALSDTLVENAILSIVAQSCSVSSDDLDLLLVQSDIDTGLQRYKDEAQILIDTAFSSKGNAVVV